MDFHFIIQLIVSKSKLSLKWSFILFVYLDANQFLHQSISEEDTSLVQSNIEQDENENESTPMPIVYKKRARIKFNQEQV